jgi:Fe-S cluster assembly ATP-binding protein
MLKTKRLTVVAEGKRVLDGVDIEVKPGEVVAVMGPNGSGKTTLARAIMGDPRLEVHGDIYFKGKKLNGKSPSDRSGDGIFLSFQNPPEVEGVNYDYFLESMLNGVDPEKVREMAKKLGIKEELFSKDLNVNFSGGEKKKMEMLQAVLKDPDLLVLDEVDSGLDIDSIKVVDRLIKLFKSKDKAILVITHYTRIFSGIEPDRVYVLVNGKIVGKDGAEMLSRLDEFGFKEWK